MRDEELWKIVEDLRRRVEELENGKKKSRKKTPEGVAQVRDVFLSEFKRRHGHEYVGWGAKENRAVATLLGSLSLSEALEYAALYPHWQHKAVVAAGHPFWMLGARLQELVAHRKRYPQHVEAIARARARENVINEEFQKDEEVKMYGQLAKGSLNPALGFASVNEVSVENRELLPGPRDGTTG